MVRIWYMDNDSSDRRSENHKNPPEYISVDDLYRKTGVECFEINVHTYKTDGVLDKIKEERGYTYEDESSCSNNCFPEEVMESFYDEHLHTDDEVRFILDGSAYFDVRDDQDAWIRIAASAGDMVIIPTGIYHRFTLDANNYVRGKRYFVGEPVWDQHHRPADDMPCRKEYNIQKMEKGFIAL